MIPRDLEVFSGGPNEPKHGRIYVTINAQSCIWLNLNCYRMLGEPRGVRLHYAREDGVIAVEPLSEAPMSSSFPVRATKRTGYRICALTFCRHFGIRIDATRRFRDPQLTEDGRMLLLNLNDTETVTVKQKPRARKSDLAEPRW